MVRVGFFDIDVEDFFRAQMCKYFRSRGTRVPHDQLLGRKKSEPHTKRPRANSLTPESISEINNNPSYVKDRSTNRYFNYS